MVMGRKDGQQRNFSKRTVPVRQEAYEIVLSISSLQAAAKRKEG